MYNNLKNKIIKSLISDDSYTEKDARRFIKTYRSLNSQEKEKLDQLFISLSGNSLSTIIQEELEFLINLKSSTEVRREDSNFY